MVVAAAATAGLVGCGPAAEPAASSPAPSAEPSPSASPSAPSVEPSAEPSAEPSQPADPTADWSREDLGWASIPLPDGWTLEPRDDAEWMVVSDRGLDMVSVFRVPEGQYAQDFTCQPEDLPAFEAAEVLPYAGAEGATAEAWTAAGEQVVVATTIRFEERVDVPDAFVVGMGVTLAGLASAESCEPFFAVYPADDVPTGILVVADPVGGLDFGSREQALAYLETDEHQTLTDLLLGIRIR